MATTSKGPSAVSGGVKPAEAKVPDGLLGEMAGRIASLEARADKSEAAAPADDWRKRLFGQRQGREG